MAKIEKGRFSATPNSAGVVLFLIGMRINRLWQIWKWFPVFVAMPRMLLELRKNSEIGLIGRPRTMISGRVVMVWQYWESFEKLEAYARANDRNHLPAWKQFNKRVRDNGSVGIFHETVVLSDDNVETVYGNMPAIGLGAAIGVEPARMRGQSAAMRLGRRLNDVPPVDFY